MPPPEDLDRLRHIVEAAREAIAFAAGRLSPETQAMAPDLPWPKMVGMRNRLIHDYFRVDLDVVWDTVTLDLPALLPDIGRLLRRLGEEAP
jgi:uncharacterized protein with HEPN domain